MDIQMKTGLDSGGNAAEVSRQARPVVQQSAAAVVAQEKAVQPVSSAAVQDQVKNAVENVNRAVQNMAHGSNVEFIVDKDTKINVIKVVDKATSEVIRQFPSEEILSIAKAIDTLQGLIIRQKA
jgi:flagellar protein FlaG